MIAGPATDARRTSAGSGGLRTSQARHSRLAINEAEAGTDLLADLGLLESAVLRNHPFIDANRRMAVVAVLVFYGLNGHWLEVNQDELVALAVDVAEGILDLPDIQGLLKRWLRPLIMEDPFTG